MKTYPHDIWMDRLVLRFVPHSVTPNQITLFRLIATPFVLLLVHSGALNIAVPVFIAVAFTDAMDGSLARTRNMITEWGMVWDPIADKILIGSVAALLILDHFPVELAVLIFGVEAIFLIMGYYRKRQGRIVSANVWGKIKMLLQVVGVVLFLLSLVIGSPTVEWASYATFIIATVFAVISLFTLGI